jgi:O-methyltransferase
VIARRLAEAVNTRKSQPTWTIDDITPYTMTTSAQQHCLADAIAYVAANQIPGDIVECGVWRGGSMMLAATQLIELGAATRDLWLFDTFEGMTPPSDEDRDFSGCHATEILDRGDFLAEKCRAYAPLELVAANLASTGYPRALCHFVKGPVEETLPNSAPASIAILRLDTDWYRSTKHELVHLFPRLSSGGILIVDDYGHWQGARKAVDEYFAECGIRVDLQRIDHGARCVVKAADANGSRPGKPFAPRPMPLRERIKASRVGRYLRVRHTGNGAQDRSNPGRTHSRYYILTALREELRSLAAEVLPERRDVLVDFGAGVLPYRGIFEPHVNRYIAVDLPGRRSHDDTILPVGDPSLGDGCADVVLSTQVLEHVPDVRAYLRECHRMLNASGRLILSTHGSWQYHPDPADFWRWTPRGLQKTLEDAGFVVIRMRGLMGLAATGVQLLQDGIVPKLPRAVRPAFCLVMQAGVQAADTLHSRSERDNDACVFVAVAVKRT